MHAKRDKNKEKHAMKTKFAAPLVAGVLTLSIGLAGCGGNASTDSAASSDAASATETAAPAESTASTATPVTPAAAQVSFWQGDLSSGKTLVWKDDAPAKTAIIYLFDNQTPDVAPLKVEGPVADSADATAVTVTDAASGQTFSFKITAINEANKEIDAGENGTGALMPIDETQFNATVQAFADQNADNGEEVFVEEYEVEPEAEAEAEPVYEEEGDAEGEGEEVVVYEEEGGEDVE